MDAISLVGLVVICSASYTERTAYSFFDVVKELFRNEPNFCMMEKNYLTNKYQSSLKTLIEKYDNIAKIDKLIAAIGKSEVIINQARKILDSLLDKADDLQVK
jgi:hypothetical protein